MLLNRANIEVNIPVMLFMNAITTARPLNRI